MSERDFFMILIGMNIGIGIGMTKWFKRFWKEEVMGVHQRLKGGGK